MILLMRFIVLGYSMEPTFRQGQTLLVSSIPYLFQKPKVDDVIVIKDPQTGRLLLKRISKVRPRRSTASQPVRLAGEEAYFVSGDNPNHSRDSNSFGALPKGAILGKVIFKLQLKILSSIGSKQALGILT